MRRRGRLNPLPAVGLILLIGVLTGVLGGDATIGRYNRAGIAEVTIDRDQRAGLKARLGQVGFRMIDGMEPSPTTWVSWDGRLTRTRLQALREVPGVLSVKPGERTRWSTR